MRNWSGFSCPLCSECYNGWVGITPYGNNCPALGLGLGSAEFSPEEIVKFSGCCAEHKSALQTSQVFIATALKTRSNFFSISLKTWFRGGYVEQNASYLFINAGNNGNYWSSTPNSNSSNAYNLNFNSTSSINPSNNNNRYNGFSVRCPLCARSPHHVIILLWE